MKGPEKRRRWGNSPASGTLLQGQDRGTAPRALLTLPLTHWALTAHILSSGELKSPLHEMFVLPLEQKTPLLAAPGWPRIRGSGVLSGQEEALFLSHEQDWPMGSLFLFKQKGCQMLSLGAGRCYWTPGRPWQIKHFRTTVASKFKGRGSHLVESTR